MRHVPTGLSVTGEVAVGRYTDREARRLREELHDRLWVELETKVFGPSE
jgi:hypothetical protein